MRCTVLYTLNPFFKGVLCLLLFLPTSSSDLGDRPPPPLATRLRSDKHILIPCPTPQAQGFKVKVLG